MGTPSVSEESSGIFSDAINISSDQFNVSHYGNSSVSGQYNSESSQELGMLVGDGIVLSPNEAQMFKKIQKIVAENKNLKDALVVNSGRLQNHVDDCIQWKENHKIIEDGLKDQLKAEKHTSTKLQSRLDFLNRAMSESSMNSNLTPPHSSMDFLIVELNRQSKMLGDVLQSAKEAHQSSEHKEITKQAYEMIIGAIEEFVSERKFENLDEVLSHVQNFCEDLKSHDGKILRDAITSIQDALKDYQISVNSIQSGHQIPLTQHVELKNQLEIIMEENQVIKNQLRSNIQQYNEKENSYNQLKKERDEIQTNLLNKNTMIQQLTEELENCHSVEILDLTPQQQPKEIKQLEANIESYKKTISTLKDDLNETSAVFDKIEEENSALKERNEQLQGAVDRLNDMVSSNCEPNFMPDVNMSYQEQKLALQHYSMKVVELETTIRSVEEELNILREKQLVTYQLSDNDGIPQQELLEQLGLKEEAVNESNKKLKLKEEECVEITNKWRNIKREMLKRKDEDLETKATIEQLIQQLKVKEVEIKNANEMLNDKQNECVASVNHCEDIKKELKRQRIDFEMKSRIQRNRESKDADRINNLMKSNDDLKKEYESIKSENAELRQHIESFQNVIHQQNLSGKPFANLMNKSEELISIVHENVSNDTPNEDTSKSAEHNEYIQSLLAENVQLSEELEKLRIHSQQLHEENEMNKTNIENLTQQNNTESLLAENAQLSEGLAKLSVHIQQLHGENEMNKTNKENLTQENNTLKEQTDSLDKMYRSLADKCKYQTEAMEADANMTQRYAELQKEYQLLQENLQEETQHNRELHEVKKHLEEQVLENRKEINLIQQQLEANNASIKDFTAMQDRLVAVQRASEKLKRDNQQTWGTLQMKVKNVKELEEKVNELTTELVGAKELIEDLGEKVDGANKMIAELLEKERRTSIESKQMRDQVEEVTVLRMQLDVYKNDFQAERESREKQQTTLLEERERVEQLQLENHRLKEEVQKKGDQRLSSMRQRFGNQPYYGNNQQSMDPRQTYGNSPQSMDPRQSYGNNAQNYNAQNYGRDARGQGAGLSQDNQWQQQRNHGDWQVYGRGNEQNEQRRAAQRPPNNRMDEDEQRKCPKCQEILPDLDSLQIHVMECLDK